MNYEFHRVIVSNHPLCSTYVVDLRAMAKKGINFVDNIVYLDWKNLFDIRKLVYSDLDREFYANMYYHEDSVYSYVKGCKIHLHKESIGEVPDYYDVGVNAYITGKWDIDLGISHKDILANICENILFIDSVNPNYRVLGPIKAQLHCIITHILLSQNGLYQRITLCDTLVVYTIINKTKILFVYLMMRHIYDCIRSDKNVSLPYKIFLTYFFEYFGVDMNNEIQENRISSLKGGGAVNQTKRKGTKVAKYTVMKEKEDEIIHPPSVAGTFSSNKYLVNGIVKDVLQEFVNLTKDMINSSQQARKLAIQNENSLRKSQT
ncbi:hypothetical protein AHAS_Ahas15G0258900 [Arachis hypogaea]